jgi:hypothetical protein
VIKQRLNGNLNGDDRNFVISGLATATVGSPTWADGLLLGSECVKKCKIVLNLGLAAHDRSLALAGHQQKHKGETDQNKDRQ